MKKTTDQKITEMKQQTFGVEIEMNHITRKDAAKAAATYFGAGATYRYTGGGYDTWSAYDLQGREWKFMRDVSIHGPESEKCEMVTPILKYEDMGTLQELCRVMRRHGAQSDASRGCGIHIHIGVTGHTAQTLRNLTNIMASHENLLIQALGIDRARTIQYCRTVDPRYLRDVNAKKPKTMAELAQVWYTSQNATACQSHHYNNSRYHMLNLHSVFTKGTVEFRLFEFPKPTNGRRCGIHAGAVKAYVQLCLALSQMAKDAKSASYKPQQHENPKYAMRTWLLRLGFIGDEFATARDILTRNLPGDAAFRYGRQSA